MQYTYLTVQQLADKYQISKWTVYHLIAMKKLQHPVIVRLGRSVRIREKMFEKWLEEISKVI